MLRVIFILSLISSLFINSVAFAADEDVDVIPRAGSREKRESVNEGSSEYNRMGKTFLLDAQLAGFGPSLVASQGLRASYFLNRNMLLSVEGTYGKGDDNSTLFSWDSGNDYSIKAVSFGVHFKHFVANSFYYRAGLDYRTLNYDYSYGTALSSTSRSFKGKSVGVTFAIGNQWQFSNFTLGCDWVGITVPIAKSISGESSTSTYQQDRMEDDEDDYVRNTALNLLRFYVGAAF